MDTIRIRFPEPSDALPLANAVRESLHELEPWMPWATDDYGEETALRWIEQGAGARVARTAYEFLVTDPQDVLLGTAGVNMINQANRYANLGYWTRSSAAGKGIAVAAVALVRDWAFSHTDLVRLEIVVARGNVRSERVAEKAGALREGVLRSRLLIRESFHDATMYSIIRPDASSGR